MMKTIALTLGILVSGCSSEADIGSSPQALTLCDPSDCQDPSPLAPNYLCADGSTAGPACVEASDPAGQPTDTCQWQVLECEDASACSTDDCGVAPGAPNWTCPDGTIAGPTCRTTLNGTCGWEIVECQGPAACQSSDCPGPAPGAPNYQCPDGTIGGPACKPSDPAGGGCAWAFVECPA